MTYWIYWLFLAISSLFHTNRQEQVFERFAGLAQGTTYSIVFEVKEGIAPLKLKKDVDSILADFDMSLSLYKDSSLISRINRNENTQVDNYINQLYQMSRSVWKMTDGAFDITVGPLVKAWGFGPEARKNFTEAKRDSLLSLVGMDKISLENGRLVKTDPRINIDFNAIAQGYSVDVICGFFTAAGLDNFLVEIGGEVRAVGSKSGEGWKIGIDKPEDNNLTPGANLQAIIRLSNKAMATSGNYRKFYVENGVKYSHTINPKTGYPAKNTLLCATIIADDAAMADAIATACMVMGKDQAIQFINNNPDLQAYFVYSDLSGNFKTWISDNLKDHLTETAEEK
jgi:thiamine biosynthesis lipoprotein